MASFFSKWILKHSTVEYLKLCEVYLALENDEPIGLIAYEKKDDSIELKHTKTTH